MEENLLLNYKKRIEIWDYFLIYLLLTINEA